MISSTGVYDSKNQIIQDTDIVLCEDKWDPYRIVSYLYGAFWLFPLDCWNFNDSTINLSTYDIEPLGQIGEFEDDYGPISYFVNDKRNDLTVSGNLKSGIFPDWVYIKKYPSKHSLEYLPEHLREKTSIEELKKQTTILFNSLN
jgi:hypothetical protein